MMKANRFLQKFIINYDIKYRMDRAAEGEDK